MSAAVAHGDARPRALAAWCLFDWANSVFSSVIVTFVFSAYFTRAVASDVTIGTADWGQAIALSGVVIAILSPVLGAVADKSGRRLPWLGTCSAITIVATALLWFVEPNPSWVFRALILVVVANTAFEVGMVFYNAMLPDLVSRERIGRLSGWGWGLGYAGGLVCLSIALFGLVEADPPPFGLDRAASEQVRAVGPLVALWFAVFGLPLFLFVPDRAPTGIRPFEAARRGVTSLIGTIRAVRAHANIARFLAARVFYIDGMNTMFAFGGIYAAGTFGMDIDEIIMFGIALNVTAGLGAAAFAWIDDWIGPKRTIQIALAGLMCLGIPLLVVESKTAFWALALPLGIFMGPAQAASRSLMAHLAPVDLRTEMFGLFALSGKITAFVGPAFLAWATLAFDSQRAGMATIVVLIAAGFAILVTVRPSEPAGSA